MLKNATLPKWNDPNFSAGTRIRTALWLISEVGIGNIFTKEQHRQAFSGVAQADRRLRDLRSSGWVIHTSIEDVSLNANEQRLISAGISVWDPAARNKRPPGLSAKQRMKVLASTNYQCSLCGISGGERYADTPEVTAVLSVVRRHLTHSDGSVGVTFTPECRRCYSGDSKRPEDVEQLLKAIKKMEKNDIDTVIRFLKEDGTDLFSFCQQIRRLSPSSKEELLKNVSMIRSMT